MCRSKNDGGRRCARSPYKKSRANLLRKGDEQALASLSAAQTLYGENVRHLSMNLPADTEQLLEDLHDLGKPMIVGGSVRDACMGTNDPKDIDIEMHGTADYKQLSKGLRRKGYRVDEVGKAFGVLKTILPDGTDIDISLPRRDNHVGIGHRGFEVEVDPTLTLEDAANRRDFTLNAMYYDHAHQALVDPHGGYEDLKNKTLRHVSDAYSEDPLRVLRGVQMCSRFNLKMDEGTIEASREMVGSFNDLPNERVQQEWQKFFSRGHNPEKGFAVLRQTGWDVPMGLSGVTSDAPDVRRVASDAKKANLNPSVFGAAALLARVEEGERHELSKRLVIGSRNQNTARRLAGIQEETPKTAAEVRQLARRLEDDSLSIKEWATLHGDHAAARLGRKYGCYERPVEDAVTGGELLAHSGRPGGRWVGDALKSIREAQDQGAVTTKEDALRWFDQNQNAER